jgi:hypothetical protein
MQFTKSLKKDFHGMSQSLTQENTVASSMISPASSRDAAISDTFKHSPSPMGRHLTTSQHEFDWVTNRNPFQRLRNLLTLENNWDGYGAPPFFRDQLSRAYELYADIYSFYLASKIDFSKLAPFIAPCSDGAILFEWAGQRFPDQELEIFVPSIASAPITFLKSKSISSFEQEGELAIGDVNILLNWLLDDHIND